MAEGMIERVARAIALAALDPETRAAVNPDKWFVAESYYDLARAAIEEMRVPTEDMLEAAEDRDLPGFQGGNASPDTHWEAMISAALKQGT